jgi:dipeptidyl aminopeptidase/acylaminoacyl peptidase
MFKEANLTVDGLKIVGQLYWPEEIIPHYPAVVLCHGVPSGKVDPADPGYPFLAETISREGYAVYTFRFQGTGESEGNFDILSWTHDLKAAIDYLWDLPEIDNDHIFVVGFSAGAAVAVYVASQDKRVTALVACACPADFNHITAPEYSSLALARFRKIGIIRNPDFPPSFEEWVNNFRKVNALNCVADIAPRPLLLLHANLDTVVPVTSSQRLYEKAGEPKQIIILGGDEHRLRRNEMAVTTIISWLQTHLKD